MSFIRVAVVSLLAALAPHAPVANADVLAAASYDDTDLLKKRFLAAVYVARRPETFDHAESILDVLISIEKDYALNLRSRDLIRTLEKENPRYKEMYEPGASKGIAHYRPLEKAAVTGKKTVQQTFVVDALSLSGICLPADGDYNNRYIAFLERQKWPEQMFGYMPVRYALYLRMYKRGCVSERAFLAHTKSLLPGVRRALLAADNESGDTGAYLYLLAAANRLDQAPQELLERFIRAQYVDGSWPSTQVGDPSVAAAQGAYVIATLLHRRDVRISAPELFYAEGTIPPLPAPVAFKVRR